MPPRKQPPPEAPPAEVPSPPAFWVALADLMLGHPEGGMPVPAYRAGDRVPRESVEAHPEWAHRVARPEDYAAAVDDLASLTHNPGALLDLAMLPVPAPEDDGPAEDSPAGDDDSAAAGKDGE